MKTVLRHLRRAALLQEGDSLADGQLLELFLAGRDEAAFEALMRRHGPMVLGVCRRLLRNTDDAEDAFQATFLVLVRKAGSLRSRALLANWLYGVAYRTAMKTRAMNAKRRAKERHAHAIPHCEASASRADEAFLEQLDHELSRLPDHYRIPLVFCELEGRSRKEVARLLGVPEGTLSSRLAYAKQLLAKRLSRFGATLSLGAFATVLSPTLRASTLKTLSSAEAVPAKILALTEGVMKTMLLTKLKITVCAATLMLVAGVGATGLTYRATAQEPRRAFSSRPQADDLDSLRLEIEALRKELRATRERVKALEDEVRGQKGRNAAEPQHQLRPLTRERAKSELDKEKDSLRRAIEKELESAYRQSEKEMKSLRGARQVSDMLSRVESELQKALEKTDDEQVKEAVEKALKGLRQREKPRIPGPGERKP